MINVTKPFLPPRREFDQFVDGIWKRNWLTNNGPLVNELELRLKERLKIDHLLFLCNGTVALQLAIKALGLRDEIITTPFSYVATTSSIVWEGCTPVFVDVDPDTYNLDPEKIEAAITEKTTAILATHVFGNPCAIEEIERIALRNKLKVIYDGAHSFACKYDGRSLFDFGDISTASFHATKLFHTIEGGAVITKSPDLLKKMAFMRNFGHNGPEEFAGIGINGKNSEIHAAMGLSILPYLDDILLERKRLAKLYDSALMGLRVKFQKIRPGTEYNFSYYSILFETNAALIKSVKLLGDNSIFPRRYFYPSLSSLKYVNPSRTPISDDISNRVLCLPFYIGLSKEEIDFIARILLRAQNA